MAVNFTDTLDWIALFGYVLLWAAAAFMSRLTYKRPINLAETIALLVGLGALIFYHARRLSTSYSKEKKDETNDQHQFNARLIAHSALVGFFLLSLLTVSFAKFQLYDWFGLAGHAFLGIAVATGLPQLLGLMLLAAYFGLFLMRKAIYLNGMNATQMVAAVLLTFFFVSQSVIGLRSFL